MKSLSEFIKEKLEENPERSIYEYLTPEEAVERWPLCWDDVWTGDCWIFEMANVSKEYLGLDGNIWVDQDRPNHAPRCKYEAEPDKWISILISTDPEIPVDQYKTSYGRLAKKLAESSYFKNELKRWVRGNRIALLLCWDKKLEETEMKHILRPLKEITDDVIRKEDKIDINKADPEYYRALKHRSLPPKNLEELMDMVYDEIDKKGSDCSLNYIDTSHITDMSGLFDGIDFIGDISKWDVSNVKNMTSMFHDCPFNGDISKWNVSNVIYATFMFAKSKFNQDISKWNFKKLKSSYGMFENCKIKEEFKPKIKKS